MSTSTPISLARVWAVALAIFFVFAWISRTLTHRPSPMPSYWVGLVGLLAIGVALVWSWRGLGAPGAHSPSARGALRALVVVGGFLWIVAMVFPFL
jgi:hypothetical protein